MGTDDTDEATAAEVSEATVADTEEATPPDADESTPADGATAEGTTVTGESDATAADDADGASEWAYEVEPGDEGEPAEVTPADGQGPPDVPVLGRPLVRAEFYGLVFGALGLVATAAAARSALGGTTGRALVLGVAAAALFGLAGTFARRPLGLLRAREPVPRHWYEVLLVVAFGLTVGAIAATLVGG